MSMPQVLPIDGRNNALVPVDMNAIQLGQPNFMGWAARIIRNGEAGGTIAKISTYVLSRLLAAIVSLIPGLGIYLVGKTIAEYTRQHNEMTVRTHRALRQLNGDAIEANQNMAAQQRTIGRNETQIAGLEGQLNALAPELVATKQTVAQLTQRLTSEQEKNQRLEVQAKDYKQTAERTCAFLETQLQTARAENNELEKQNEALLAGIRPQPTSTFNYGSLTSPIKTAS